MRLRNQFYVKNLDTGREMKGLLVPDEDDHPKYFVLSPERDPAALAALMSYAEFCEDELAKDIETWIDEIKDKASRSELDLGTVGAENARHLLIQRAEESEMGPEARSHTVEHAVNLKKGAPWPKVQFLLGTG